MIGALGKPSWMLPLGLQESIVNQQQRKTQISVIYGMNNTSQRDLIRKNIRFAPSKSAKELLSDCGYRENGGIYHDFLDKNILDIGGGFGGIAPNLWKSANQITVIDPIFREEDHTKYYREDLGFSVNRMQEHRESEFYPPYEFTELRKSNAAKYAIVHNELLWWQEYDTNGKHKNIKRNSSYGENLVGIEDDSQDFVFVKCVLLKKTVQAEDFLREIYRVLKKGGCLIINDIIDDTDESALLRSENAVKSIGLLFPLSEGNYMVNRNGKFTIKTYK